MRLVTWCGACSQTRSTKMGFTKMITQGSEKLNDIVKAAAPGASTSLSS